MNIGINTRVLLKDRMEGVAWYTYEISKRLALSHPEHQFFFFFDRPYHPEFIFAKNITPIVLFPPARHPILWIWWFEHSLKIALKKYKIDVFFSPDGYLSLGTTVASLLTTHDIAYHHYPRHIPFSVRKYYQHFIPRFHIRADHVVAVSETTKQDLISSYQLDDEKISVAYNACSDRFNPVSVARKEAIQKKITAGFPYFIYLGSLHPRKNIIKLIQAFEKYCKDTEDDMQLVLAGRWAWKIEEIKKSLARSSVKDRIHIKSNLGKELPEVLASAEALIYVSLWEGFGLPIVEAFACDVPVITSDRSAMAEVAGEAALLTNPEDSNDIKNKMIQLIYDRSLQKMLLVKARERRNRFSWDQSAEIVYEKLISITGP